MWYVLWWVGLVWRDSLQLAYIPTATAMAMCKYLTHIHKHTHKTYLNDRNMELLIP